MRNKFTLYFEHEVDTQVGFDSMVVWCRRSSGLTQRSGQLIALSFKPGVTRISLV